MSFLCFIVFNSFSLKTNIWENFSKFSSSTINCGWMLWSFGLRICVLMLNVSISQKVYVTSFWWNFIFYTILLNLVISVWDDDLSKVVHNYCYKWCKNETQVQKIYLSNLLQLPEKNRWTFHLVNVILLTLEQAQNLNLNFIIRFII